MSTWLRQSTAATVVLGVFVDSVDGATAETALTISQADIRLSKNGGAFAQTNNAAGATHMEAGDFGIPLDTTDTNTLGRLRVRVSESGALPVWADFMVVPANVWDSFFGADRLQVDVLELSSDSTAADNAEAFFDGTGYAGTGNTIPTVTAVTNQVTANVTQISGDTTAADNAEAFFDGTGYAGTNNTIPTVTTVGTLTTYTGNTPQTGDSFARLGAPAGASVSADIAATLAQTDDIGAAGAGLTAIPWNPAWDAEVQSEVADALAVYDAPTAAELTAEIDAVQADIAALIIPSAGANADAVWDEVLAGHLTGGTTGAALNAAGGAGDPWSTALPGAYGAGTAGKIVGDSLDAAISSRAAAADLATVQADTDAIQVVLGTPAGASLAADIAAVEGQTDDIGVAGAGLTAVPWNPAWDAEVQSEVADALAAYDPPTHAELTSATANLDAAVSTRATPAQVNAEVLDVLTVDTFVELSAVPAATSTLKDKLGWLFCIGRNKVTQTEDTQAIRNSADDGNIASATVSDDGITFVKGRFT